MLVLRLLVMVLTIICLMDGHAEVSSSTTGIRDRRESPAVKTNELEVQIHDRKKKKKPKPSKKKKTKPGKKKKPNKAKPTPTKPVTTTPTVSTSALKTTTILTTPTITTTTTTVSPTTTATTARTTTSTASATTTLSTTTSATTTVATSSTASTTITTIPSTATTSSPTTTAATTADSGAGGECKATNGKPCIFPFKDGNEEYNECKNEGGKYFWCATSVYDSGKYKHWSYCSTDGPCPLEGDDEECRATNNKPCVFPFKDGNKEYNECADHGGKYFWCATGTNSAGKYTAWSECPKDGSCPLPPKSTTPAMTSTATSAASTSPLITGTTAATDQMEEKVLDTLENLVLGESRDDSLQMAHMLDKKLDAIIKDLEGETSKTELSNSVDISAESGKLNLTIKSIEDDKVRDGTQLGKGLMFVLSTVDSMKSVSRMSGDCCLDCTSKYPDTELAEYWETLDTCYCYKKFKNPDVEPKTRASSKFTTKACATGVSNCPAVPVTECPSQYNLVDYGYLKFPDNSNILSKLYAHTLCACRHFCDELSRCSAFLFNTCEEQTEPRCILLEVNELDKLNSIGQNDKQYAFCKRDQSRTATKVLEENKHFGVRLASGYSCPNKGYSYQANKGKTKETFHKQTEKDFASTNANIDDCAILCEESSACYGFSWEKCAKKNVITCTILFQISKPTKAISPPDYCKYEKDNLLSSPPLSIPTIADISTREAIEVFTEMAKYAETCCKKDNHIYPGHPAKCTWNPKFKSQQAFIAWIPKSEANKKNYLDQHYNPALKKNPTICCHHFTTIQTIDQTGSVANGNFKPGKNALHTEEVLLPLASPVLVQSDEPMEIYFYTYNSPCVDRSAQGKDPGCISRIFEYLAAKDYVHNFKKDNKHINLRSRQHRMNVGFQQFYSKNNINDICTKINDRKTHYRVHSGRLRFFRLDGDTSTIPNPC